MSKLSELHSSQELKEFCTKSLKEYLREALELETSQKKVNITVNQHYQHSQNCQEHSNCTDRSSSTKWTEKKKKTTPHFIEWQSPIVEWLNPLREWQVN